MATVKQSGGDYSTLNAAIAGEAAGSTITIEGSWTAADTTAVTWNKANMTVSSVGASRHAGRIVASPTYYRLEVASTPHCITVSASGGSLDGITILKNSTSASAEGIRFSSSGNFTVKNSIIRASANSSADQDGITVTGSGTLNAEQCFVYTWNRGGIVADSNNVTLNVNSCGVYNTGHDDDSADGGSGGITTWGRYNTGIVVNCYNTWALNCNTYTFAYDFNDSLTGANTLNISRCIDSDGSIATWIDTGSNNLASRTQTANTSPGAGDWVVFTNITAGSFDFRLQSSAENDAQDVHATATAHGLTIPSADIVSTSRPQNTNYDVGPFEISAGAAPTSLPPPSRSYHYAQLLHH